MKRGSMHRNGRIGRLLIAVLLAVGIGSDLRGQGSDQETEGGRFLPISFGLLGGYAVTFYSGTVDLGGNVNIGGGTCGLLDGGGGNGVAAGAFVEYSLSPMIRIGGRFMLEDQSGAMTLDLPTAHHRVPSGAVVEIAPQYRLDLDVSVQTIELYGGVTPFGFPLTFSVGPKIGIPSSPSFTFAEEISGNEEVTFENGTTRNQYAAGNLESELLYGLHIGADYRLPMGDAFELQGGVAIYTYLNGLISDADGPVISGIRPSLGLLYRLKRPQPDPPILLAAEPVPPPPPPAPEPPAVEPVRFTAEVSSRSTTGEEIDHVEVVVDVRSRVREVPILPYVFFEQGSAEVPTRYMQGREVGDDASPVEVYRGLLDIVGRRMAGSGGNIRLVGTIDGSEAEQKIDRLALDRARSVGNYLVERWGIDPARIEYGGEGLPSNRANPELPGAAAENRRVEIRTDGDFLDPLRQVDSVRTLSSTPLQFVLRQISGRPVDDWRLQLRAGDRSLRNIVGASSLIRTLDIEPTDEEIASMVQAKEVRYELSGFNREGAEGDTSGTIEVRVRYRREEGARLENARDISTPILFAYNSAELSPEAVRSLQSLRERIPDAATLRIIGYADDLGGSEYNRNLSRRRAEAVAALFPEVDTTVVAAGEVDSTTTDQTPEARYYARTVRIEVESAELRMQD